MPRNPLVPIAATLCLVFAFACGHKEEAPAPAATTSTAVDTAQPVSTPATPEPAPATSASATLESNQPGVTGTVTVTPEGAGVKIVADISGLPKDGKHGFHVHETGQCEHAGNFKTAGGHFNPTGAPHACPPTEPRHAGDLGNIDVSGGKGHLEITSNALSLSGPNSVVGKAFIVHVGEDDCKTQPTGNSGDRLACGVVTSPGGAPAPATTGAAGTSTPPPSR